MAAQMILGSSKMIGRKNSKKGQESFLHVALHLDLIYNPTKYYVYQILLKYLERSEQELTEGR